MWFLTLNAKILVPFADNFTVNDFLQCNWPLCALPRVESDQPQPCVLLWPACTKYFKYFAYSRRKACEILTRVVDLSQTRLIKAVPVTISGPSISWLPYTTMWSVQKESSTSHYCTTGVCAYVYYYTTEYFLSECRAVKTTTSVKRQERATRSKTRPDAFGEVANCSVVILRQYFLFYIRPEYLWYTPSTPRLKDAVEYSESGQFNFKIKLKCLKI